MKNGTPWHYETLKVGNNEIERYIVIHKVDSGSIPANIINSWL
jgi:hypothetical protein